MAKKSVVARNIRRQVFCDRHSAKRNALKAIIMSKKSSLEQRMTASAKITEMPRDSSPSRVRNRCSNTGRPRGTYRDFGICRNELRRLAYLGLLPGVAKCSL